jgi:hypothetical protein
MIHRDYEREAREERERIRGVTQCVIDVVGATGPADLEEAVTKALNELRGLRSIVREVYRAMDCAVPPDDTWGELPSRVACMRAALDLAKVESAFESASASERNAARVMGAVSRIEDEAQRAPLEWLRDTFRGLFDEVTMVRLAEETERRVRIAIPEAAMVRLLPLQVRNTPSGVYLPVHVRMALPLSLFSLPSEVTVECDEDTLMEWIEGEGEEAFSREVGVYLDRLAGFEDHMNTWDVRFEDGSKFLTLVITQDYYW